MVWVEDLAAVWVEDLAAVGETVVVGSEVGVRNGVMAVFVKGVGDVEKIGGGWGCGRM